MTHFAQFKKKLSSLSSNLSFYGKNNMTTIHNHAEDFSCILLNLVYEWDLENINKNNPNHPGIDLVDHKKKIAVQVSAAKKNKYKITKTLSKSLPQYEGYNLKFFFITESSINKRTNLNTGNYNNEHKFTFNPSNDIYDLTTLLLEFKTLNTKKQVEILKFVDEELNEENCYTSRYPIPKKYKLRLENEEVAADIEGPVYKILKEKLHSDFKSSCLINKGMATEYYDNITQKNMPKILNRNNKGSNDCIKECLIDDFKPIDMISYLSFYGQKPEDIVHRYLKDLSKDEEGIKISIACNSVAAIAAGLLMSDLAKENGYELKVDFSQPAGKIQLLNAYALDRHNYQAIIVGCPAFEYSQFTKYDEIPEFRRTNIVYKFAIPVHQEYQSLLYSPNMSDRSISVIHVPRYSATQEAVELNKVNELLKSSVYEKSRLRYKYCEPIDVIEFSTIPEKGEGLLIWEPLDKKLLEKFNLIKIEDQSKKYRVDHLIGMFLRADLIKKEHKNCKAALFLLDLFVYAFNYLNKKLDEAYGILCKNKDFIERFSFASGMKTT